MNKEITYQHKRIFYRISGSGKPVILVHGFGEDGEVWRHQSAHLEQQFKLIVPDLPGSGRSEQ
ncbi:MAG: alpha/beta hydrolase, partial [Chitinophagaceae bacterium]|nr:alpha/beta hydrolase [Chitinophagaceae bacterium]